MRAAIYTRVSTEEQALHGFSLANQREECRQRAQALGAVAIMEFTDEGLTGKSLERPGLKALREAVYARDVDLIVILDPDRLSRRLAHQLLITEEIEKAGIRLEFVNFEWQDSPEGRLFYSIRGAISEFEREKIRERMVRGKNQKARQGGIPVCFDIFGYSYDPETGVVQINEEEAEVVRDMFKWFTMTDIGVLGIAHRLNEAGVPTRRNAGQWWRQVVRQMLGNSVYKGEWLYGKVDWSTRKPRKPEAVIRIPVPAVIDPLTWERAQEKLRESRHLWAGRENQRYLLSGVITCADCGATMCGCHTKYWGRKQRRYTCRKPKAVHGVAGCRPTKMVSAEALEDAVWQCVRRVLISPEDIALQAASDAPRADKVQKELERIGMRLKEIEKGRESMMDVLGAGLIDLDDRTRERLARLKQRKERLESRRKDLKGKLHIVECSLDELKKVAAQVAERLDDLSWAEKRGLVRALVVRITVSGRPLRGTGGLNGVHTVITLRGVGFIFR